MQGIAGESFAQFSCQIKLNDFLKVGQVINVNGFLLEVVDTGIAGKGGRPPLVDGLQRSSGVDGFTEYRDFATTDVDVTNVGVTPDARFDREPIEAENLFLEFVFRGK